MFTSCVTSNFKVMFQNQNIATYFFEFPDIVLSGKRESVNEKKKKNMEKLDSHQFTQSYQYLLYKDRNMCMLYILDRW